MSSWSAQQGFFTSEATRVASKTSESPAGLTAWHKQGVTKRFNVYRNNIFVSLIDSLKSQFPVTLALIGDECFTALAREYSSLNLPESPVLLKYGANFPEYLLHAHIIDSVPYIADMAQFEWMWLCAYHAAEAPVVDPQLLATLAPEDIEHLQFVFHPSAHMFTSDYPIIDIWHGHMHSEFDFSTIQFQSQSAIIVRPEADVLVLPFPPENYACYQSLKAGASLGQALELTVPEHLPYILGQLLGNGCITEYSLLTPDLETT